MHQNLYFCFDIFLEMVNSKKDVLFYIFTTSKFSEMDEPKLHILKILRANLSSASLEFPNVTHLNNDS